jgi:hypothetical protein
MIATLLLTAALLAPGAARLPAYHPLATVACAIAVCSAFPVEERAQRPGTSVSRRRRVAIPSPSEPQIVPLVLTTQLRR